MNIFISYSSKDRAIVESLAADLTLLSHSVWFDRELTGGHEWWGDILSNIRHCDLFVFALTPASLASYPCRLEYEYAHKLQKRILPVMIIHVEARQLPQALQRLQFIDYRKQDKNQALLLSKALNNLPAARALPDHLPEEPEVPIKPVSPLDDIRNRMNSGVLDSKDRKRLVSELKEYLDDDESSAEAQLLLIQLERNDFVVRIQRGLHSFLQSRRSIKASDYRAIRRSFRAFTAHTDEITSVAFSPDGRFILTGSKDETARLWETETARSLQIFRGHAAVVEAVAFSPDSCFILTGGMDNKALLWDVNSGQLIKSFMGHVNYVESCAFSPDGKQIVTASWDRTARLWDIETGREIRRFAGHNNWLYSVAFSPDGKQIVTASWDRTVRLWDVETGKVIKQFVGHNNYVREVIFSPNGEYILTGSADKTARLWDINSGEMIRQFVGHNKTVRISMSRDGRFVLTGADDRTARLWNVETGEEMRRFAGQAHKIKDVIFSPDSRYVLTAGADGVIRLWPSEIKM